MPAPRTRWKWLRDGLSALGAGDMLKVEAAPDAVEGWHKHLAASVKMESQRLSQMGTPVKYSVRRLSEQPLVYGVYRVQ